MIITKKLPDDFEFLKDMYEDDYFPNFLVDKLRDTIKETVSFIEEGGHTKVEVRNHLTK